MSTIALDAKAREVAGKKVADLRAAELIPAVLYGDQIKNINITVEKNKFLKAFEKAGTSTLIDLSIDGKAPVKVLIYDYQNEPVKGDITHVDFYQIREDRKLTTTIHLEFFGEAPAIKEFHGILVKNIHEVEVSCLPKDLVSKIDVDLSVLKTLTDAIHVKDLVLPAGIELVSPGEEVVAKVTLIKEEVEAPVVTPEATAAAAGATPEAGAAAPEAGADKKAESEKK